MNDENEYIEERRIMNPIACPVIFLATALASLSITSTACDLRSVSSSAVSFSVTSMLWWE